MGNSIPSACLTTSGRLTRDIAAQEADVSFARKKCGGSRAKFEELRNRAHKLLTSNRKADAFLMTDDIEDSKTTMQQDSQVLRNLVSSLKTLKQTRDMNITAKATTRSTKRVQRTTKYMKLTPEVIGQMKDEEADTTEQVDEAAKLMFAPVQHAVAEVEDAAEDNTEQRLMSLLGLSSAAAPQKAMEQTDQAAPVRISMDDDDEEIEAPVRATPSKQPRIVIRPVTIPV